MAMEGIIRESTVVYRRKSTNSASKCWKEVDGKNFALWEEPDFFFIYLFLKEFLGGAYIFAIHVKDSLFWIHSRGRYFTDGSMSYLLLPITLVFHSLLYT